MRNAETRFYYRARNPAGDRTEGYVVASSARSALTRLKRAGIRTIRLESGPIRDRWWQREVALSGSRRLTTQDCARLCEDLSVLLSSGFEVSDALGHVQVTLPRRARLALLVRGIEQRIRLGASLSDAFKEDEALLPPDFVPVLRAGEAASRLSPAIAALAESYRQRARLQSSISSALAYPLFLLGVVTLVVVVMATQVAPTLGKIFLSANHPVPLVIGAMWNASDFAQTHMPVIGAVGGTLLVLGLATVASGIARRSLVSLGLRLPVFGAMLRWDAALRFASALKLANQTNLPLTVALPQSLDASGLFSRSQIDKAVETVRHGSSLALALKDLKRMPPQVLHLVAIGEQGNRLAHVLGAIETEARMQLERRFAYLSVLLGPAMILLVGGIVGSLVYSVFSALMEINNLAT